MRLAVRIGERCSKLHGVMMRDIQVNRIELDEIWSFVGKKQKRIKPKDGDMVGDQYTFLALADTAKAIITYRVGKRTAENTQMFADEFDEKDAAMLRFFAEMFLRYVFELSGKVAKFRAKPVAP